MTRTLHILIALVLLAACVARAELSPAAFEAANKFYEQGKFTEAAAAYEKLSQSREVSAALYFNLGNAYFKSSQIGRAIVAYRHARQLTPRDPDVRANLQFARNQVQGPSLPASRIQRWLGRLTLNEWTWLAAGAVWLLFLLLAVLQWRPALKSSLRTLVIAVAVAAALLCASLATVLYQARPGHLAIVVKPDAVVRLGPMDDGKEAFVAHDGAEFTILEPHGDWLHVSAGPLRVGWVRRDQVVLLPQN